MSERYEIRGRVGKGGMSEVYRAFDTVMKREVALKRLLPVEETNLNEASSGALAREASALARFQHPNVVTVFAFEEDAEGAFVVMELIEGEDLHSIMKSGALSWDDFCHIAPQCLDPLVAAGELNLLHRDIKPGNIMLTLTASGRFLVKLLDFGLAKFSQQPSIQTLDQRGSFLGSIEFIAPEQLELYPLDQRTDLYSLGCVFYYMLTQESPFAGGNPAETSMNHLKHRCKPIEEIRKDIPPLVSAWLMRLISRHPDDRPSDASAAYREFRDAINGIPYEPMAEFGDALGKKLTLVDDFGPPSTGPVGPPTASVNPPKRTLQTGPVVAPKRNLQTGPVVAPKLQTGAVKTAPGMSSGNQTTIAPTTGQRRLSNRIKSVSRGRTPDPYRPVGRKTERDTGSGVNWKLLIGIVLGVITLIGLGILLLSR